jgi:membrane protease YdiL (CAAX protease family)
VLAPVLLFVVVLGNLFTTHWSALTGSYLAAALALGVLVGFGEEIATRGAPLVGLRGRLSEVLVRVTTCILFGAMHGLELLFGAPPSATLVQMVTAAMHGSVLYIVRRTTGSLIWAMALHGLLDFSVFVVATSGASNDLGLAATGVGVGVVGVVLGFFATEGVPESAKYPRTGKRPEPA